MTEPVITPELLEYLEKTDEKWKKFMRAIIPLPQRAILALMTILGVTFAYAMRVCLSLTIIAIVEPKNAKVRNGTIYCPFPDNYHTGHIKEDKIYSWDEELIGHILSSFYIGYVITHIPGGILSDFLGGKYVLTFCVALTSLLSLITPACIEDGGPYALMVLRLLMGLTQGTMFPAVNVLLASWIPRNERAFYGSTVYASSQVGTVIGTAVAGVLVYYYYSWTIVYYIFGASGLIWSVLFSLTCANDPLSHSYISNEEKELLLKKIGKINRTSRIEDAPWIDILKNIPLLALVICECGHDFGFYVMVTDLPKYLSDVLHFNIYIDGYLSALPFITMFVVSMVTGYLADLIIDYDLMSLVNCRKLFTALSSSLPATGMILASYAGCDQMMVIIYLTVGMGTMGFFYSGLRVNALDLSPRFAGTLMAYINGVGAIMGAVGPTVVGSFTPNSTVAEFRLVFWITFGIMTGTCVVFLIFASGEIQPFDTHGRHHHRRKSAPPL